MLNFIDNFLNKITMYRLTLYYLIFLMSAAIGLSLFGILPFGSFNLLTSATFIMVICLITNAVFARVFKVPANVESVYITALILTLIMTPIKFADYSSFLSLSVWSSVWAMASKYILAIKKKHIFNPAAFAVALTSFTINQSASWWIGTTSMAPFVLIGGFLVVRKLKRSDLVWSFTVASLGVISGFSLMRNADLIIVFERTLLNSSFLFLAFVMLTEPLTTPPKKSLRILYGVLTGFLFAPQIHIGSLYSTPELALIAGNIFSYLVSPKQKLLLRIKQKIKISPDIHDFIFQPDQSLKFSPGQYMEFTLGHDYPDSRGNRRYFTIASSPTENNFRLGIKFYEKPSSFKKALLDINPDQEIAASQLAGDFVMPLNKNRKLVFIAGGIGITPFRSMIKYLLDRAERRDIILFYSNKSAADIVYKDIFDLAADNLGIKTIYTLTENIPEDWTGQKGFITEKMLVKEVPDYQERLFYVSGPHAMVNAYKNVLKNIGVNKRQIKMDFFPGFV